MNGHLRAKGRDLLVKARAGLLGETVDPLAQNLLCRLVQQRELLGRELLRQTNRRQSRAVQDLIGIGVTYAAEQSRIGEGPLQRVVLPDDGSCERVALLAQYLEPARVVLGELSLAPSRVK